MTLPGTKIVYHNHCDCGYCFLLDKESTINHLGGAGGENCPPPKKKKIDSNGLQGKKWGKK